MGLEDRMSPRDLAKRLLDITGNTEIYDQTVRITTDQIVEPIYQRDSMLANRVLPLIREVLFRHKSTMIEINISEYIRTFSEEELRGLIRFYESDVGRALASKMPNMIKQIETEITCFRYSVILPEIEKVLLKEIKRYEEETNSD